MDCNWAGVCIPFFWGLAEGNATHAAVTGTYGTVGFVNFMYPKQILISYIFIVLALSKLFLSQRSKISNA